jgi:hypothetical protein
MAGNPWGGPLGERGPQTPFKCHNALLEADLFGTFVKSEPSIGAFAMLQIGVPLCALLAVLLVPNPFDRPAVSAADLATRIGCVLVSAATAGIAGMSAAIATRRIAPDQECGRWIWIIPSSLVLIGFVSDSLNFSVQEALSGLFLPKAEGEDWWAFLLLTCPTIACITYSAAFRFLPNPLFARQR